MHRTRLSILAAATATAVISLTGTAAHADSRDNLGHCHQWTSYDSEQAPGQTGTGNTNAHGDIPSGQDGSQVCAQNK
jgi:hypothetical protein